jgi:hypothetical protein
MVALDRRTWIFGAVTTISTPWKSSQGSTVSCLSFQDAVDIVCRYSPPSFRRGAVLASGRCLYRGESVDCPTILHPKPDLLLSTTYNDSDALKYFECLEDQLSSNHTQQVRPSNGHIGIANQADATLWGSPVSVWPLGDHFNYVWPKDRSLMYPGGSCPSNQNLVVDDGLQTALENGKEVMFASWFEDRSDFSTAISSPSLQSAFMAFPVSYERDLLEHLARRF